MTPVAPASLDSFAAVTTGPPLLAAVLGRDRPVQLACGGSGGCASCHVHVQWGAGELSPVGTRERKTLDLLADPRPNSRSPNALARFAYEAQLMARLSHPNVVRVLDYENHPDRPYVVMDYVDGASAADLLARAGRLPADRVIAILLGVADGLASAHRLGVVHRDVKPGNILVGRDGTAKLVDLGLATMVHGGGPTAGALEGTLAYMSPEQASTTTAVDARSDIYSLGVTFYHLVTGRLPFTGPSAAAVLLQHQHRPTPPLHEVAPGLSAELGRVVGVMMAKRPRDRYRTCDALSQALAALPEARRPGR